MDKLKQAIRNLVASMYNDLHPANDHYQGDYEWAIEEIVKAIEEVLNDN